ncbi:hypothetical protein I7I51_01196 [Histoplasma capsulatum]|uniref:Uncharacterized protein n=1 Tax=Ajellomyces capsulatus TaxID=5037 RepID=A0A8A1MHT3_AJECA|nr:hypothetical protein I7I51_01196 [Histoplasma capsulatum]
MVVPDSLRIENTTIPSPICDSPVKNLPKASGWSILQPDPRLGLTSAMIILHFQFQLAFSRLPKGTVPPGALSCINREMFGCEKYWWEESARAQFPPCAPTRTISPPSQRQVVLARYSLWVCPALERELHRFSPTAVPWKPPPESAHGSSISAPSLT